MRSWIASLALAACSGVPSAPRPAPAPAPVAIPSKPSAPPPAALWPELNLGFEQLNGEQPTGWRNRTSYESSAVGDPRHGGAHSLRLRSAGKEPFGSVIASVPANVVRGKRLF